MDGGPDDDYLFGWVGSDAYDGGDGSDTADFSDATTPVSVTLNGAADDGSQSEGDNVQGTIESLIGGLDDDQLNANDGSGILDGGGGNDLLNGGLGPDAPDRRRGQRHRRVRRPPRSGRRDARDAGRRRHGRRERHDRRGRRGASADPTSTTC